MVKKKARSKPKTKNRSERLPKMSQQIMTSELAWDWIVYATRTTDARQRIGEIPRPQLLTLAELLERSPIVNPTKRLQVGERKPRMKQAVCKCCGEIFEYDCTRGGRPKLFKNIKHQKKWHNHQTYLRRKAKEKASKQRQKVLKGKK